MVITKTPFRISFFGGGTDYPVWLKENEGIVLSTTINKYCYIVTRELPPFFNYSYRIRYTQREEVKKIHQIQHPSVRACLGFLKVPFGIEMVHTSDLPAMSGLGSSSAFTVGFLNSLYGLKKNNVSKKQLAKEAIYIEQEVIKENVGSQDQVATCFGGLNIIKFKNKNITVNPLVLPKKRFGNLQNNLMLFFTGFQRNASDIASKLVQNTPQKTKELNQMFSLTKEAQKILLSNRDLAEFGKLLDVTWQLKKSLANNITTSGIDQIYATGIEAGAIGGKLLGAGSGGFILFYVEPDLQSNVKNRLKKLVHVPFAFESEGSKIIHSS